MDERRERVQVFKTREELLNELYNLRIDPKRCEQLNSLEKKACDAIKRICPENLIEDSRQLYNVLHYIGQNGYTDYEKPLLQEIVMKKYFRGF